MASLAKDDQRVYGRRDNSFSVTPEVHSHLCGITETKGDRTHHTFLHSKRSRKNLHEAIATRSVKIGFEIRCLKIILQKY